MRDLFFRYRKHIIIFSAMLFVFFVVKTIFAWKRYTAIKAKYAAIDAEREKREAIVNDMNEKVGVIQEEMKRIIASSPGGSMSKATDYVFEKPYEGQDKWYPWSNWQGAEPLPDLFKVDMSDPAIDFDRFEEIYLSSGDGTRVDCIDGIMLFDITHPDMDSTRKEVVRRVFKKILAHDYQYVPEMCIRLSYYLAADNISLENIFAYADILAPMVDATDEAKGREKIRSSFHRLYGYLQLQLEKIPDDDKRNDMLLVVKNGVQTLSFNKTKRAIGCSGHEPFAHNFFQKMGA